MTLLELIYKMKTEIGQWMNDKLTGVLTFKIVINNGGIREAKFTIDKKL